MSVDTTKYLEFVDGVTSEPSKDLAQLLRRISELEVTGDADVPHLLTAALGLTAEQVVALRDLLSHVPDPSKEIVELYDKVKLL